MSRSQRGQLDFAAEYEQVAPSLWVLAVGLVGRGDAEDVLHEAAILAMRKADHYRPGTNFRAWLAQFVRNVARNHQRRRQRWPLSPAAGQLEAVAADGVADRRVIDESGRLLGDAGAFQDSVVRALDGVEPTRRACLLLRAISGLAYDEIARVLEIPPGTAMSHVARARAYLAEQLADLGPPRGSA